MKKNLPKQSAMVAENTRLCQSITLTLISRTVVQIPVQRVSKNLNFIVCMADKTSMKTGLDNAADV